MFMTLLVTIRCRSEDAARDEADGLKCCDDPVTIV
jgi:hypothetical protein